MQSYANMVRKPLEELVDRRTFLKAGTASLATGALAGCTGAGDEEEYPSNTLELVNHFSEGGGQDQNFREIQPHWEEAAGGEFSQNYQGGAGTRNGMQYMMNNTDDDMYSFGASTNVRLGATYAADLDDDAEPALNPLEDIEFIGTLAGEATILRVRSDDERFSTLDELVDYAQNNPDELRMGSSGPINRFSNAGIQFLEAIGVEMTIVPYDGGGPVETALMQGEVDVVPRGVYNSRSIEEESTALAIYADDNEWAEITDDAPPIGDELDGDFSYGPTVGYNVYYTTAAAVENHPDRYDMMVDAYAEAINSEAYLSDLDEVDEFERLKVDYLPPEDVEELVEDSFETYQDFLPLFDQYLQS